MSHPVRRLHSFKAVNLLFTIPTLVFQILLSSYFSSRSLRAPSATKCALVCTLHLTHLSAANGVDLAVGW